MMDNKQPNNKIPEAPSLEEELLNKKVAEMEKRFAALQEELGLLQIPVLNYTSHAVIPGNVWMTKEEFDRRQKQAGGQN